MQQFLAKIQSNSTHYYIHQVQFLLNEIFAQAIVNVLLFL